MAEFASCSPAGGDGRAHALVGGGRQNRADPWGSEQLYPGITDNACWLHMHCWSVSYI